MKNMRKMLFVIMAVCLMASLMIVTAYAAQGTGHDHELEHFEAIDACHQNGMQEYWYCDDCDAVFADESGIILTNRMNLTIPALGDSSAETGGADVMFFVVIAVVAMGMVSVLVLNKKKYIA